MCRIWLVPQARQMLKTTEADVGPYFTVSFRPACYLFRCAFHFCDSSTTAVVAAAGAATAALPSLASVAS